MSVHHVIPAGAPASSRFQLQQGDCLPLLRSIPDCSVDAIISDPPYNSGGTSSSSRTSQTTTQKYQVHGTLKTYPDFGGDNRDQHGFAFWCSLWLAECFRVAKPGAPILLFSDWRQLPTMSDILQAADFIWRGIVVWDKTGSCRPTLGRFTNQAEYVVWGSKGGMPRERNAPTLPGVFAHRVKPAEKFHITGKPLPLMVDLLRIVERPAEGAPVVLDPFAGSGTTGVAALELGFDFIGFEREPAYYDVSMARLLEAGGHQALVH